MRRKLMTLQKVLLWIYNIDRLCVARKEGGRWFTNIEDSIAISIRRYKTTLERTKKDELHQPETIQTAYKSRGQL